MHDPCIFDILRLQFPAKFSLCCLTWSYASLKRCDLHFFNSLRGKCSFVGFFSLVGFFSRTMTTHACYLYMIVTLDKLASSV